MIEKLRKTRDEKRVFTAFLTDMSKAFDFIPDQLLIAKLIVYGFHMKSLAFISAYLKKRKQKLGPPSANVWIYYLVSFQGSNLRPLLFMKFVVVLFCSNYDLDFASCAVQSNPYICELDFSGITKVLKPNFN